MSDIKWKCEKRKINDLKPHPGNPRVFTEKGMKDLKKSINKIGMAQPINITPDGTILSGHARYFSLKDDGVEDVDVYVSSRDLTEEEQKEVLIRMNANIAGQWDMDMLANEFDMEDLADWGLDLDWKTIETSEEGEEKEINIEKCHCKIIFSYVDSHDIIDKFLREMKEKYPELLYEVQFDD